MNAPLLLFWYSWYYIVASATLYNMHECRLAIHEIRTVYIWPIAQA